VTAGKLKGQQTRGKHNQKTKKKQLCTYPPYIIELQEQKTCYITTEGTERQIPKQIQKTASFIKNQKTNLSDAFQRRFIKTPTLANGFSNLNVMVHSHFNPFLNFQFSCSIIVKHFFFYESRRQIET